MNVLYSFSKQGFEAEFWTREIAAASTDRDRFIPFNHAPYLDPQRYVRAQLLDNLYYVRHPALLRLYADLWAAIRQQQVDVLLVDNSFPYHPEFLRTLPVYKVLRTTDGPVAAYDRDFAFLHAYDHVLHHSPAYSRDLTMAEKLRYCGATNADFWPLALFDAAFDPSLPSEELLRRKRDIDVLFIGALHLDKMPLLARVKKALGRRCRMHGLTTLKRNVYFNVKHGMPGWIRPVPFSAYIPLYQRTKIGFNVHNRGMYTVGSYRLFELPANGVMQISDGGPYLADFFDVGREIVGFDEADDLIDKIRYYLAHDEERQVIARRGHERVLADHRFGRRMREAVALIERGMQRTGWTPPASHAP